MGRDSVSLDTVSWMFDKASSSDLPALQRLALRGPSITNKVKQGSVYVAYEMDGRFHSEPLGGPARDLGGFITCEPDQFKANTFVVGQIYPGKCKFDFLLRQLEQHLEGEFKGAKTLLCLLGSEDRSLQQAHLQAGFSPCGTLSLSSADLRVWYKKEL